MLLVSVWIIPCWRGWTAGFIPVHGVRIPAFSTMPSRPSGTRAHGPPFICRAVPCRWPAILVDRGPVPVPPIDALAGGIHTTYSALAAKNQPDFKWPYNRREILTPGRESDFNRLAIRSGLQDSPNTGCREQNGVNSAIADGHRLPMVIEGPHKVCSTPRMRGLQRLME